MWYIWLITAGIFFIAEIITVGFLLFWLGISALFAMIASFITDSLFIQTLVFVISSCILIPLTKPLVNKFVNNNVKTNVFSLIGKEGFITTAISPNENGQVKIDGQIWSTVCENSEIINVGTKVKVIRIDGVKLVVEPILTYTNQ